MTLSKEELDRLAAQEAEIYNQLTDPENILAKQKEAEEKQKDISTDSWHYMRRRAKTDLFWCANGVLGYDKMTEKLHGHMCKWVVDTEEDRYRLMLLPRGHYKSTIFTISDSIRISLPCDGFEMEHPYNLGPDVRILIGHESSGPPGGASRFLREITGHFLANTKLMALFPECVPTKKTEIINQRELELPRHERWGEPTFDTLGVGVLSQGRHYDFIKFDDLYGVEARDSRVVRAKTISWFNGAHSFFVSKKTGHLDLIGTRYSLDDIYDHAMNVYGSSLLRYIRRVEETIDGKKQLIFPEETDYEGLLPLMNDPVEWVQHTNDPIAGLTKFDPSWKSYYEWLSRTRLAVFSGSSHRIVNLTDCDIVILIDPARQNGKTGIVVTAMDSQGRVFILDTVKGKFSDQHFCNLVFHLVQRWNPRTVCFESVLFSELYQPWFEAEMKLRGVRFNITLIKRKRTGSHSESKHDHIKALSVYWSSFLIFHHSSQTEFEEEFDSFGATDDIHMLDALAYGPQIWTPGIAQRTIEERNKSEAELFEDRDLITGYSAL